MDVARRLQNRVITTFFLSSIRQDPVWRLKMPYIISANEGVQWYRCIISKYKKQRTLILLSGSLFPLGKMY